MNFLNKLMGAVDGIAAQVNPFDHGATYSNPHPKTNVPPSGPTDEQAWPRMDAKNYNMLRSQTNMHQMPQLRPTINQQGDPTGYPGGPNVPIGQDPADYGYPPEISLDPTGREPYSAKTPELMRLGNQYGANPTSPRFIGVDPAQFGYPLEKGAQPTALSKLLGR